MELVRRMKIATSSIRSVLVLSVAAGLTIVAGLLPLDLSAQEGQRTIATGSNIPLSPEAPDEYVVKPGDTLWDISKVFLRDPWYWPEIWHVNPQIENPHLIYPGDVLKLVYIDGQPRLTVAQRGEGGGTKRLSPQVRREPLSEAITAIPYDIVASFMGRPTLLEKEQVRSAPYLVAMRDEHIIAGAGYEVYARGIEKAAVDERFSIIHIDAPIRDPETNDLLGYTGIYVGSGSVVTPGDPAKLLLTDSSREALQGDKVFPESQDVNVDFVPHAPTTDVDATVIATLAHSVIGQYQVVALNRGSRHGLEPGHVLGVSQRGAVVRDRYSRGGLGTGTLGRGKKVQLPHERVGLVMVFKAFDRMSYALVMETSHEIRLGDLVHNP
nr:peptidoglycan-binding protein [Gammaproteobacteria bacterium]